MAPYEPGAATSAVSDIRCFWVHHAGGDDPRGTPMLAEYALTTNALSEEEWEDVHKLITYYEVRCWHLCCSDFVTFASLSLSLSLSLCAAFNNVMKAQVEDNCMNVFIHSLAIFRKHALMRGNCTYTPSSYVTQVFPQRVLMSKRWNKTSLAQLDKLRQSLSARLEQSAVTRTQAETILRCEHGTLFSVTH